MERPMRAPAPERPPAPVRLLKAGDLEAVLAIEAHANPVPWHKVDFLPFVQSPDGNPGTGPGDPADSVPVRPKNEAIRIAWVHAGTDAVVRGFACAMGVVDEVELQAIAVDQNVRSRGFGTALLEVLVDWAGEAGYRAIHLEVRAGNAPALALYRRFGFAQVGCRRGYYQDNGEDAWLLTRIIQPRVF